MLCATMGYYSATNSGDRAKALTGVLIVHAAISAVILSGLNVTSVNHAVESLKTFNVVEAPPPPPEPPPPPRAEESAPKDKAAPANIRSRPKPVVTPRVLLPKKRPRMRGPRGEDRTAGASDMAGTGTGAGGQGSGYGGGGSGGSGSGRGYTPAQRIGKIPDSEYRRIVAVSGRPSGIVGLTLKVNTDGRASNCRVARSSGNPSVDALMCGLALRYVNFRPARDPQGRPVAQDMTWYPDWSPK